MIEKVSEKTQKILPIINLPFKLFYHTPKAKEAIDFTKLKEILVVFYAGIGDGIMNLPFLTVLKKNAPNARITLVCSKSGSEIVKKTQLAERIIVVDLSSGNRLNAISKVIKQINTTSRKLNDIGYDLAIEPRGDLRCIYLMYKCNATRRVSYNYTGGENLLTDVIVPLPEKMHLIDDQLYLLKRMGISYTKEEMIPVLRLNKEEEEKNFKLIEKYKLKGRFVIGIHPGASLEIKRWKSYGQLAQKIGQKNNDAYFFVFSAKGEEYAADSVYNAIKDIGLDGQIIKESLEDYIRIIAICNMMICNDSGSGHIAAAYGIPTIVLFGPMEPSYVKPYGKNHVTLISHSLECKPCRETECKYKSNDCLKGITVDEVFEAVEKELKLKERDLR